MFFNLPDPLILNDFTCGSSSKIARAEYKDMNFGECSTPLLDYLLMVLTRTFVAKRYNCKLNGVILIHGANTASVSTYTLVSSDLIISQRPKLHRSL